MIMLRKRHIGGRPVFTTRCRGTRWPGFAAIALSAALFGLPAQAETAKVVLQYGISYLPLSVMQAQGLWEKRAKELDLDLKVDWQNLGNGGALNDAILAGSADIAAGGFAPMMKLWDKTRNNLRVRGIAALNSSPVLLVTNRPDIRRLRDFKPDDRIALSIPKVSYQAIVLQMAAEMEFGPGSFAKLDVQTVSMKHPDAVAALLSPKSPIAAYFGSAPYQEYVLKRPGISKVLDSFDVFGGPVIFTSVWSAAAFPEKKPVAYKAFLLALGDAMKRIEQDKPGAVDDYIKVTGTAESERALLLSIVEDPKNVYAMEPQASEKFSEFLARTGFIETKPRSWKDYFFPGVYTLGGS
jgi:NitT/TauT family transport system substrate-binding protein